KTSGVVENQYGVYVPGSLLGLNTEITHEIHRSLDGTVRVIITAYHGRARSDVSSSGIDSSAELRWLSEHRSEYAGQWVGLNGDKLIASGPQAADVYEAVRKSGVELPLVTQIEPEGELPFAGW